MEAAVYRPSFVAPVHNVRIRGHWILKSPKTPNFHTPLPLCSVRVVSHRLQRDHVRTERSTDTLNIEGDFLQKPNGLVPVIPLSERVVVKGSVATAERESTGGPAVPRSLRC